VVGRGNAIYVCKTDEKSVPLEGCGQRSEGILQKNLWALLGHSSRVLEATIGAPLPSARERERERESMCVYVFVYVNE
jgi:hypothetical protein